MNEIKYFAVPAEESRDWDGIFDCAEKLGIYGNDFIGCFTYRSPKTGGLAIKLDRD